MAQHYLVNWWPVLASILRSVPKPLLSDIVAGRCIPVIGAGFSYNAVVPPNKRMPLWDDLGRHFAGLLSDYPYSTPIDAISAYCHEYSRTNLVEELMEVLHVKDARPGPAHRAFCNVPFNIVCTTNFDFLLEKSYDLTLKPTYCKPVIDQEQLSVASPSTDVLLIKLHGDLNHPNRLVITEEDYDLYLERCPLMATYLGYLLVTRTPLFIGYSLEDPDFRQIWQTINSRLGQMRRMGYVIAVESSAGESARFERRGVKVIGLPGKRADYGQVLEKLFIELRDYVLSRGLRSSTITVEAPQGELLLPKGSANRLCFFAIPYRLHSFYRSSVFPIVENLGLVPLTAEAMVWPGDNILAKITAIMDQVEVVVVDVSGSGALMELDMALSRKPNPPKILMVVEERSIPPVVEGVAIITRPRDTDISPVDFLRDIEGWLREITEGLREQFANEPKRLLGLKEYRAAVISAFAQLEATVRQVISQSEIWTTKESRPYRGLDSMFRVACDNELIDKSDLNRLTEWRIVRNRLLHEGESIRADKARMIVDGVDQMISKIRERTVRHQRR